MTRTVVTIFAMLMANVADMPAFAIVNGNAVTAAEQQQKGLVIIQIPVAGPPAGVASCSGVLVTNDWVLTAGHCADQDRLTPGNMQVVFAGTTISVQAAYLFGGFADEVGPDMALLHLSTLFKIGGSTTSFRNQLWNGGPHDLSNRVLWSGPH